MAVTAQTMVRITLTDELKEGLEQMRSLYPYLSDADLFKLAFGNYVKTNLPGFKPDFQKTRSNFQAISARIANRIGKSNLGNSPTQDEIDNNSF